MRAVGWGWRVQVLKACSNELRARGGHLSTGGTTQQVLTLVSDRDGAGDSFIVRVNMKIFQAAQI